VVSYLVRRLAQTIPLILLVVVIDFSIIHIAPGDPVTYLYADFNITAEEMDAIREDLGLNDPIIVQLLRYMTQLLSGDFWYSHINRAPVLMLIVQRLPATLLLAGAALLFSVTVGVALGCLAAYRARSLVDYFISAGAVLGYCMPVFWLGIILILVFAVELDWFPAMGMETMR
jgi:peptide/nickel transport system permease protein